MSQRTGSAPFPRLLLHTHTHPTAQPRHDTYSLHLILALLCGVKLEMNGCWVDMKRAGQPMALCSQPRENPLCSGEGSCRCGQRGWIYSFSHKSFYVPADSGLHHLSMNPVVITCLCIYTPVVITCLYIYPSGHHLSVYIDPCGHHLSVYIYPCGHHLSE